MPTDAEVRQRINKISDKQYQNAFRYQYLIAGRISEVCGQYAPRGIDATPLEFDGEKAIMFMVKTAKRKGRLRGVAVPLDEKYEPWTLPVYEYFVSAGETHPFKFADKWTTSIRYMQWEAERAFEGMEWPMFGYSVKKNDVVVKIPSRWKNMTSHVMRKRRTVTLLFDYDFSGANLATYGGWTMQSQESMPQALKYYLYIDPDSTREGIKLLEKMASGYFKKLLKPYQDKDF